MRLPFEWFIIFVAFGFINLCINPLVYAGRYEVFRKSLRRVLKKDSVVVETVAMSIH